MAENPTPITCPDSEILHEFADMIAGFESEGKIVRTTITICVVDSEVYAAAHSSERLTAILGALPVAGQIIQAELEARGEA